MGVAGRQRAVEVFSESRALTAYAELFNSLGLDR
jgi:hypothetical protein